MTTRAETIANHLRQIRGLSASDARCLHLAFLECLGGAECASPAPAAEGGLRAYKPECDSGDCILPRGHAEDHWDGHGHWPRVSPAATGPWVVRVEGTAGHLVGYERVDADSSFTERLSAATRIDTEAEAHERARKWSPHFWRATVLPLAEAERAEKERASLDRLPAHTKAVLAELDEEPSAEVLAMDDSPDEAEDISATLRREECERKAARQAKPAGWVLWDDRTPVRLPYFGRHGWAATAALAGPYQERDEAEVRGLGARLTLCPVDAAGNVIEGGVAWEAARSYEEAERLRSELAAVKAERDTARAERDAAKAERDKLTTDEADLRYALRTIASLVGGAVALGASTEMHCAVANEVRLVVERLKREEALAREGERIAVAERDRLAAEVQRGREQKPVRWALCSAVGDIEGIWFHESDARALAGTRGGWTIAPLYLAPVVRDHSEVIAQCEEALHRPRTGYECERDSALRAALAALRGAP